MLPGARRRPGPDRPVYGLTAPGLTPAAPATGEAAGEAAEGATGEAAEGAASVEELAAAHVAALRRTRPAGPYHLAGWSFGGLLAYEMAAQLRAAGEEVATLTLLDTAYPEPERAPYDEHALLEWFHQDLARSAGTDPEEGPGRPCAPY
ncbi:thioesterase domain-containing protein [Streptomyces cirratus]